MRHIPHSHTGRNGPFSFGGEGVVLATSRKTQDKELPLRAYPPIARGVGVVVEGACLLVALIGRLGRRGTGLVGMPNEVPAAVEH